MDRFSTPSLRIVCLAATLCACTTAGGNADAGGDSSPCDEVADCAGELQHHVMGQLGRQPYYASIVAAACVPGGVFDEDSMVSVHGMRCDCETDGDTTYMISSGLGGCAVRGHAHACLMRHGEFDPCDADDPHSCDEVCAELEQRLSDDASVVVSFEVRRAWCEESDFEGLVTAECKTGIIEVDGFCFPVDELVEWNRWQSCELSDEEIRDGEPRPLPDCDDIGTDVPETVGCFPACDTADDCAEGQGCWHGPADEGFGVNNRGQCNSCFSNTNCLSR